MTRPLDGIALQTYFRRLNLQKDAQDQLIAVRSSPPSRLPDSRAGNMPVWYPSKKMQCIIKAESAKVEFAFLLEAEHDDEVVEFWDQPPPIELSYHDRRGRLQQPLHTADYFVFRYKSAGWEECKPVEKLIQFAQQHSKRYVLDERGQWRCPPGEIFAAKYGLTYRVRASDQINWASQDNWLYLEDYYQDLEKLAISEADLAILHQIVDKHPGLTLADLREAASPIRSEQINIAIARHALYADLAAHRLTEPERTPIFRDHKVALTHHHRGQKLDDLGMTAHPVVIEQGSQVLWNGKPWRIAVGQTELTLVCEEGKPIPLSRSAFDSLVKEVAVPQADEQTKQERHFRNMSPKLRSRGSPSATGAETSSQVSRANRYSRYEAVRALHQQGLSLHEIARRFGMARKTVRQFIRAESFPERSRPASRGSLLDPYKPYLLKRWQQGCCNGAQLSEEIKACGYTGSGSLLRRFLADLRKQHQAASNTAALALEGSQTAATLPSELPPPPQLTRRMSPTRASWLCVSQPAKLDEKQRHQVEQIRQGHRDLDTAYQLSQAFVLMLAERRGTDLDAWLVQAKHSGIAELKSLRRAVHFQRHRMREISVRGSCASRLARFSC